MTNFGNILPTRQWFVSRLGVYFLVALTIGWGFIEYCVIAGGHYRAAFIAGSLYVGAALAFVLQTLERPTR